MIIKQIPNFISGLNLLLGCIGITFVFSGNLNLASICILISAFLDFFDGFAAKFLNAQSHFGKELDSLADIISFGVLPASIIFFYMNDTFCLECQNSTQWLVYSAYLIAVFSAVRLAKFNISSNRKNYFSGLPTPANAILIASIPLVIEYGVKSHVLFGYVFFVANNFIALMVFTILSSALLVMPLKMLSLKFESFELKNNRARYLLILFAIFALLIYNIMAIPMIIIFYILLSIIIMIFKIKI